MSIKTIDKPMQGSAGIAKKINKGFTGVARGGKLYAPQALHHIYLYITCM